MTSRERVLDALNFQETDRVPCDLDAMGSTGISAFAYPKLVKALGLPPRRTRIYDTWQMIAVVDRDVLDALECDCICVNGENCANVLPEPEKWRPYDFNGRLEALVLDPSSFRMLPDGTIEQRATPFCDVTHMPPNGYVFSEEHGGQAVDLSVEYVLEDLDRLREQLLAEDVTLEQVRRTADYCWRAKEAGGERVLLFNGVSAMLGYRCGLANFSMLCLAEPDYVRKLHEILTEAALRRAEALIPAVAPYVERQAAEMTRIFSRGGYVFTAIHNIMAEIAPEKVIAMYRSARSVSFSGNRPEGKGMASC